MTIEIGNFTRKPFDVEAVQVTNENMKEVSKWCKGSIKNAPGTDGNEGRFILVKVHNAANDRHKQAFPGDWIFYSRTTGHKVYSDRAFRGSFDQKPSDTDPKIVDALEEERTDTKPEIPVVQVLVDEFNASHKKTEDSDDTDYRSAVSGQFVTEEYAKENPDITVEETSGLSPEDQARLLS